MSAIDDRVNEALNRALESVKEQLEATLSACRDEVSRVAAEEGTRVAAAAAEAATLEARREAERQLNEWREVAAGEAEERERDAETRVRQAEAREHDAAAREREADAERRELEARLDASERITEELRRSLEEARVGLEHARVDLEETRAKLDDARQKGERDVEAARQDAKQVRHQLDEWLKDIEGFKHEVRAFQDALAEATAQAARLPDAMRTLDQAGSLADALDTLVRCAAREAERAAVFLVKGDRLHDWRVVGFNGLRARIEIPADEPGLFGEAIHGNRGVTRGTKLPAFADGFGPRHAVAMPIRVGGAVVAVLYADTPEADKQGEPVWPERLEMLARYAGRMLELITIRQAAGLSGARAVKTAAVGHPPAGSVQ